MRKATSSQHSRVAFVAVGLVTVAGALAMVQPERDGVREQKTLVFRLDSSEWTKPYDGPLGFPKGVQTSPLGVDPISKGITYYARFPAGSHFELHSHSYAEYATVLRGTVTLTLGTESHSLQSSDYVVIPAKMVHEWKVDPGGEMVLLVRRDGPADFIWVDP